MFDRTDRPGYTHQIDENGLTAAEPSFCLAHGRTPTPDRSVPMDGTGGRGPGSGRRCALPRSTPTRLLACLALLLGIAFSVGPAAAQSESPRLAQSFKEKAKKA